MKARDQPARRHREQVDAGDQEADRRARQDRVRHRVADEAHPPQHQKYADRRGAERKRDHGGERAAHELEFGEGRDQRVVKHQAACDGISSAQAAAAVVERLAHPQRDHQVFRGQHLCGRAPRHRPAREQQRFREMVAHQLHIVQRRQHGAALAVPALHQRQQVGRGLGVDGVERLVQHDQARVLQQHAREQHALHLAAGQRADRAVLKPVEADGGERLGDLVPLRLAHAAEKSGGAPQAGADQIEHRNRKAAVDIDALRQIGDVADIEAAEIDRARQRLQNAGEPAKQRRLAGAVRPDHRHQRTGSDLAVEVMHRRMPVVAERDVVEFELRRHAHLIATSTTAHRAALTASAAARRAVTVMRRIDQGAGLRRMRRRRAMGMGVAMVMMRVVVGMVVRHGINVIL